MKNPYIIPAAMISAAIWVGFWMLKPPPQPPDISIHKAANTGNIEAVKQHLAAGTDVNAKDSNGMTPLHHAAYQGHIHVVELLIDNGADVNAKDDGGWVPLSRAAMRAGISGYRGHKEIVELLIAKGADVNMKDEDGKTPLDYAIGRNQPESVDLLRKHGGKTGEELKAAAK